MSIVLCAYIFVIVLLQVCSKTIRQELTKALDRCLPRIEACPAASSNQRQPFASASIITFEDDLSKSKDLTKILVLRKALRAAGVNGEKMDADTKILRYDLLPSVYMPDVM